MKKSLLLRHSEVTKSLPRLDIVRDFLRHSEQSEESISKSIAHVKDSSVTTFPQNDDCSLRHCDVVKPLSTLDICEDFLRHSEQSEESISKFILNLKDSSVTSFPQNDDSSLRHCEVAKPLSTLNVGEEFPRHSELCEESISKSISNVKDSSVTSFPQNDDYGLGMNDCSSPLPLGWERVPLVAGEGLCRHCEEDTQYPTWQSCASHPELDCLLLPFRVPRKEQNDPIRAGSMNFNLNIKPALIDSDFRQNYPKQLQSTLRSSAFTLAEVLITLGIIGVVAAMTLPNLISSYREKQTIVKLKKNVAVLQNAFYYSKSENNVSLLDTFGVYEGGMYDKKFQEDFANFFFKNLITNKSCGNNCFADKVKNIDKSTVAINFPYQPTSYKSIQLNDGTTFLFRAISYNCSLTYENYWNICGFLYIDVDGKQNGSTLGRDTFLFYVKNYSGLIPAGVSSDENAMNSCYSSGGSCTNWLLINENMDYLHCKDLSWNGKTKCK